MASYAGKVYTVQVLAECKANLEAKDEVAKCCVQCAVCREAVCRGKCSREGPAGVFEEGA